MEEVINEFFIIRNVFHEINHLEFLLRCRVGYMHLVIIMCCVRIKLDNKNLNLLSLNEVSKFK